MPSPQLHVRTPLNTIHLSLHLLAKNIEQFQEIIHRPSFSLPLSHDEAGGGGGGSVESQKTLTLIDELSPILAESLELLMGLEENSAITVTTLNDLINYDKIETNTFVVEKKEVDLWPLIGKTISPLTFVAEEKNIQLEYKTQLSHPTDFPEPDADINLLNLYAIGDASKLGQMIRNLVSNALKFTPIGGDVKVSGL
jgi:signal transduction histidine kinase